MRDAGIVIVMKIETLHMARSLCTLSSDGLRFSASYHDLMFALTVSGVCSRVFVPSPTNTFFVFIAGVSTQLLR